MCAIPLLYISVIVLFLSFKCYVNCNAGDVNDKYWVIFLPYSHLTPSIYVLQIFVIRLCYHLFKTTYFLTFSDTLCGFHPYPIFKVHSYLYYKILRSIL